jgi:PAS domain S-box-containing protein
MGTTLPIDEARRRLHEVVRGDAPFDEKASEALELGTRCLGADSGSLTRIDRETDHWEAVTTADGQAAPERERDLRATYCRETVEDDTPLALHDAPDQGWDGDPAFEIGGDHTYLGVPLVPEDETYGTVCFVAEEPREAPFSDAETRFAEHLARLLERELAREHAETELTNQTTLATVLNRVLRHNIRNDIAVVRGYTELMAEQLDDETPAEIVQSHIDELIDLSQKARELEGVVSASSERQYTEIGSLIDDVAETVTRDHPEASVSVESDGDVPVGVLSSFDRAVEELIENAVTHGGEQPTVTVTVDTAPDAVEIRVADDGPGLPEPERKALERGTETSLDHGSGLGLWLAYWIVTSHDGSLDPVVTEGGTTMEITIPRKPAVGVQQRLTELTRSRDRYKAAFEAARDAVAILDDDGRILDANSAMSDVFGPDTRDLIGRPIPEFLPGGFDFEAEWRAFREDGTKRGTVTVAGADGTDRVLEYAATADIIPGQHLVVCRDVTDREERERELRARTRAMEKAPVGIVMTDPNREDNPITYTNERFSERTGYDDDEIVGRNCRVLQGAGTKPEPVRKLRTAIDDRESVTVTLRNYRADGTEFWNRVRIAPVEDDDGTLTNYVGFQQDVTDRIERER